MNKVYIVSVMSESGDDYGSFVYETKPTKAQLRQLIKEEMTGESEYLDSTGPGLFGTYLHFDIKSSKIRK